jgi:hypothetical protein
MRLAAKASDVSPTGRNLDRIAEIMLVRARPLRSSPISSARLLLLALTFCTSSNDLHEPPLEGEVLAAEIHLRMAMEMPAVAWRASVEADGGDVIIHGVHQTNQSRVRELVNSIVGVTTLQFSPPMLGSGPPPDPVEYFPWPPPGPSSTFHLEKKLVGGSAPTMAHVADRLRRAFDDAGYPDVRFFAIPGGFVLLAPPEQVDIAGRPVTGSDRWSVALPRLREFSLSHYLRMLVRGRTGFYRVIAIAVTNSDISPADVPGGVPFSPLHGRGQLKIPRGISNDSFSNEHYVVAMVYEFEKSDRFPAVTVVSPGRVSGIEHLRRAKVMTALER